MTVHEGYSLAQLQSLPLEIKERMSLQRIETWYNSWKRYKLINKVTGREVLKCDYKEPKLTKNQYIAEEHAGAVYVSFSGGKDSTVVADLAAQCCKENGYNLYLLFVNTGLEYPEVQQNARNYPKYIADKYHINVDFTEVRPNSSFKEVLTEEGYPVIGKEVSRCIKEVRKGYKYQAKKLEGTRLTKDGKKSIFNLEKQKYLLNADFKISDECCDIMKKAPAKKYSKENARVAILGNLAAESLLRKKNWQLYGCNAFGLKNPSSTPLAFWTEQDVLRYIRDNNLPIASVYGEIVEEKGKLKTTGVERTGCIFCMFGAHCKGDDRFLKLAKTHPKQYNYCINGGEYNAEGQWQPSKEGLGLGHVLDFIGCTNKYKEEDK